MLVLAESEVEVDDRRSEDWSVTLSVVIEQIFHERTNKIRAFKKRKKKMKQSKCVSLKKL